jgi:hypothetical protein
LREKQIGVVDESVRAAARSRGVGGDGAEAAVVGVEATAALPVASTPPLRSDR